MSAQGSQEEIEEVQEELNKTDEKVTNLVMYHKSYTPVESDCILWLSHIWHY